MNETITGNSTISGDTSSGEADNSPNTHNTHQDIITINNVTNFDMKEGSFELTQISATEDWNNTESSIDNYYNTKNWDLGTDYERLAQEIKILYRINLTRIRIRIGYEWRESKSQPTGDLYIVDDNGGNPSSTNVTNKISLETDVFPSMFELDFITTFKIITFDTATLDPGNYYLVLEDTTASESSGSYWRWAYELDSANGNYATSYGYIGGWGAFSLPATDLYLQFESLRVDSNNNTYIYSNPDEVALKYNGTAKNVNSFPMLLNEYHNFTTNVSVLITGDWIANYTATNLIDGQSSFRANSTYVQWNVTAQNYAITDTSISVKNHLFNVTGLPSHWNATGVYYNTSSTNCTNYSYTNGSSILLFNATSNITQSTWHFVFQSFNYIESVTINGSSSFPYTTNQTVVLDIDTTFKTGASGGNKSLVVHDINDVINYTETEVALATHFFWNVSENLDQTATAINGTYELEVWWNGNSRAGFISVDVDLEVTTNLTTTPDDFDEKLINTLLNVTAQFNNTFNFTGLQGATVKYNTTWGENGSLTEQSSRGNYTVEGITTADASFSPGDHEITINASLSGYLYQEVIIPVKLTNNATLDVFGGSAVNYTDNTIVYINYTLNNGTPITGATIKVNDTEVTTIYNNDLYEWTYDSDNEGLLGLVELVIEANKTGYMTRNDSISLTIENNPTIIYGSGKRETDTQSAIANKSITNLYYNDSFVLELQYEDLNHSLTVDTYRDNLTIQTTLNYTLTEHPVNHNWTLTFDINNTDDQVVNVTFSFFGYDACLFMANLTITEATTATTGQASGTEEIYFNEYHFFTITYTDTVHSEDIINATVTINGICSFIFEGNTTGTYSFNFTNSLNNMVNQSVSITFTKFGYDQKVVNIDFGMLARPTELTEELHSLANETTVVVYYQENYTLSFNLTDVNASAKITESTLPIPVPTGDGLINESTMFSDNYNFTFYFNVTTDTEFKTFDITITFEKYGYDNQTFDVHFEVRRRDVTVVVLRESISQDNETEYLVAYLNNLEFNFTLTDLNSTVINDFTVDNSTNVTYYGGTSYDFNFPADMIGYFSVNITFTRFGYNSTYWYFNVTVNTRPTELTEELHSLANETTVVVYYQEDYTLSFNLTDVNASVKITESTLPIPVPTGDGLINGSTMFNDNYNFTFYFNVTTDTEFKTFDITITFAKYGYDNQTFDVHFDVRRRDVNPFHRITKLNTWLLTSITWSSTSLSRT
ncbi:MAG: hypothetical protein ACXAEU_25200 [Candidatus Hodarchaeales archaeon]|jgi:hypothetical protein